MNEARMKIYLDGKCFSVFPWDPVNSDMGELLREWWTFCGFIKNAKRAALILEHENCSYILENTPIDNEPIAVAIDGG